MARSRGRSKASRQELLEDDLLPMAARVNQVVLVIAVWEPAMSIRTILDHIKLGSIALPEFQRGYVGNRDQVRDLIQLAVPALSVGAVSSRRPGASRIASTMSGARQVSGRSRHAWGFSDNACRRTGLRRAPGAVDCKQPQFTGPRLPSDPSRAILDRCRTRCLIGLPVPSHSTARPCFARFDGIRQFARGGGRAPQNPPVRRLQRISLCSPRP